MSKTFPKAQPGREIVLATEADPRTVKRFRSLARVHLPRVRVREPSNGDLVAIAARVEDRTAAKTAWDWFCRGWVEA